MNILQTYFLINSVEDTFCITHCNVYSDLKDSLLDSEKISSISGMQTKYETEKKVQEINLLNEQNKWQVSERNIFIV